MSSGVPSSHSEMSANGSVSGTASRIVIGWTKLSNCAARIMYMKMNASKNAMAKFELAGAMPARAEELFAWHARPGAFFRLIPPWEDVKVSSTSGPFADGFRIAMRAKILGPIGKTWTAELFDVQPGKQFRDRQLSGPFAAWTHTHRMTPTGPNSSELHEEIDYQLPFGPLGRLFGSGLVRGKLEAMFAYRHALTRSDLTRHARFRDRPRLTVAVTGSSGLVGNPLCWFLNTGGHRVVRLLRTEPKPNRPDDGTEYRMWDPTKPLNPTLFRDVDAVIHLAGDGIADGRWTAAKKARIRDSRTIPTRHLAEALAKCDPKPKVLLSASAVGIYGDDADAIRTESSPAGSGFLADTARDWEAAARPAADAGIRVVHPRIGIVQSAAGGALAKQVPPFRSGAGAVLGHGRQWVSWIALNDLVGGLHHALMTDALHGPVNMVAPRPVTNRVYGRTLAAVLGRPYLFTLPAPLLRLGFGEMADGALLASTRCEPTALLASGFAFDHAELEPALRSELGKVTRTG